MKSDWHRYNLKRRIAELPPVTSYTFAQKVLALQEQQKENDEDEYGFYVQPNFRKKLNMTANNQRKLMKNARDEYRGRGAVKRSESPARFASPHSVASDFSEFSIGEIVHSPMHTYGSDSEYSYATVSEITNLNAPTDDEGNNTEEETCSQEALEILPITFCFFCGENNNDTESNILHMLKYHGLYLPERSYLKDVEGLLTYVSEAVTLDHLCLVCGFQGRGLESIRQHLRSKGHAHIPYETKADKAAIEEFYDFAIRGDYLDDHSSLSSEPRNRISYREGSDEESVIVDGPNQSAANCYTVAHVDRSGVELTLPNGSRIGHRTMQRYYRQNLPLPVSPPDSRTTVSLVDSRYASGVTTAVIKQQEKQTRLNMQRDHNMNLRRDKSAKLNFKAHFRDAMLGG